MKSWVTPCSHVANEFLIHPEVTALRLTHFIAGLGLGLRVHIYPPPTAFMAPAFYSLARRANKVRSRFLISYPRVKLPTRLYLFPRRRSVALAKILVGTILRSMRRLP